MTVSLAALVLLAAALAAALFVSLRRSRKDARFRDLVEGADDVILRIDAQGRIEYANPAAGELVGQEPAAPRRPSLPRPRPRRLPRPGPSLLRGPAPAGHPDELLRVPGGDSRRRGPLAGTARAARDRGRRLRGAAGGRAQRHGADAAAAGDRARARAAAPGRGPRPGRDGDARPRAPAPRAQRALAALPRARRAVGRRPHDPGGLAVDAGALPGRVRARARTAKS